jgi:hypothetical protein
VTVIRKTLVAVALALTATACGGQTRMGAAAIFDGVPRISEAELSDTASAWQDAYRENPLPAQELRLADPESIKRSVLSQLIALRVTERVAAERGIEVTSAQVDGAIRQITQNRGEDLFHLFTLSYGLPPSHSRDFARMILIQGRLAVGADSDAAANEQIHQALAQTARKLKVKVNPRYGASYEDGLLQDPATRLSRQGTGAA